MDTLGRDRITCSPSFLKATVTNEKAINCTIKTSPKYTYKVQVGSGEGRAPISRVHSDVSFLTRPDHRQRLLPTNTQFENR